MPAKKRDPDAPGVAQVQFLTVAEVAAMMRVSKMTVYRLVHNGELPAVRVGKSFRVPERAAPTNLEAATLKGAEPPARPSSGTGTLDARCAWCLRTPPSGRCRTGAQDL